jgi:hypothetical protein
VVIFVVVALLFGYGTNILFQSVSTPINNNLAVNNVNGGNYDWMAMEMFNKHKNADWMFVLGVVVFGLVLFNKEIQKMFKFMWNKFRLLACCLIVLTTGCFKPYDQPEYCEIQTSETAFVIALDGDTTNQAKFESAKFLESKKVSTKRIQIPHRWVQTGRFENDGKYIDTVKVVIVDRSPVTRIWKSDANQKTNDAIWIESADSVGFSMGWSCTAYITEEDASTFLYMYPSKGLNIVMDNEVRARIQQISAQVAANYKLDELRGRKNELAESVRKDVVEFFSKRGITITTVAMVGGMTYENNDIQKAIDITVVSQQEKVNAKAMLDAQEDKNLRIKSEAQALADAAKMKAKGEAEGQLLKTQAEAQGVRAVSQAIAEANNNPQLVALKQIEVDKIRAEKWDGKYPDTVVGAGSNLWVGLGKTENGEKMEKVEKTVKQGVTGTN